MCAQNQVAIEEMLMLLAAGYFDESTDEVEERCYTVAGYVGWGHHALHLDLKWKELLDHWGIEYFKASQIEFGMGAMRHLRDDPDNPQRALSQREKDLIVEIKTSFIDLICESGMLGVAATVLMRDFMTFRECEPVLAKRIPMPYHLCSQLLLVEAAEKVLEHNGQSRSVENCAMLRPVFDSHEDHSRTFSLAFPAFRVKNPQASSVLLDPMYETEQAYRCIQAADCLAYESRRLVEGYTFNENWKLRRAMDRLKEHTHFVYYLNYEGLKFIAESQSPSDGSAISPIISEKPKDQMRLLSRKSGWVVGVPG